MSIFIMEQISRNPPDLSNQRSILFPA